MQFIFTFFFDQWANNSRNMGGDQNMKRKSVSLRQFGLNLIQDSFASDKVAGYKKYSLSIWGFKAWFEFEDFVNSMLSKKWQNW